jgi:hypothetical protein
MRVMAVEASGGLGLAAIPAALQLVRGAVPPGGGRPSPTRGTVRQPRRNRTNSLRRMPGLTSREQASERWIPMSCVSNEETIEEDWK